jgi:hypothetical protein
MNSPSWELLMKTRPPGQALPNFDTTSMFVPPGRVTTIAYSLPALSFAVFRFGKTNVRSCPPSGTKALGNLARASTSLVGTPAESTGASRAT